MTRTLCASLIALLIAALLALAAGCGASLYPGADADQGDSAFAPVDPAADIPLPADSAEVPSEPTDGADLEPLREADPGSPMLFEGLAGVRVQEPRNLRISVIYECWYALRQGWLGRKNLSGPHDPPADRWGHTRSNWDFLSSDMGAYNTVCGWSGQRPARGEGRGGQCPFFARLILLRGTGFRFGRDFWGRRHDDGPAVNARPGDLIFKQNYHVAVAVQRLSSTHMDVVDSNWHYSERICRHPLDLRGWRYMSGRGHWY